MSPRKFFKTKIVIEVLSEEPLPDGIALEQVINEAANGDYSMKGYPWQTVELDGKDAADALLDQASDPSFFGLDENGNDL